MKYLWVFIIVSCSNKEVLNITSPIKIVQEYYPNIINKYVVYEVKKITYKYLQPTDSMFYQLKEVLADTFTDLENKKAFKLERYIRYKRKSSFLAANTDSTWKIDSVWNARISLKQVIVYENNVPFLKINYPLNMQRTWNGNLYNILAPENYTVSNTELLLNLKLKSWGITVSIVHKNDSSAINKDLRYEIYSKNIGLVYVKKVVYEDACKFNFDGTPCVPGDKIASGMYYEQNAIRYEIPK